MGVAVCGRGLSPGETEARLPPLPSGPWLVWAEQLLPALGVLAGEGFSVLDLPSEACHLSLQQAGPGAAA